MTATGEVTAAPESGPGRTLSSDVDPDLTDDKVNPTPPESGAARRHGWRSLLVGGCAYLLLSGFIWERAWQHPTSSTTCGCGDSSLFTWFLEWPAYAIAHGLNPFYSTAMHVPGGVNLLANTSVIAIGLVLAPITWLFGPVASLNVALTLAPTLSAFAMFMLLRRWVSWAPAAFIGGLLYGFSPFILVSLNDAHLMLGMAVVPPLIVACLDELLIRQQRRPVPTGIVLGLLTVLQFFIGTEVLVIMVLAAVVGIAIVALYAALRRPAQLRLHAPHAAVGLLACLVVTVVVLIIPAWYALAGPAAFGKTVWPGIIGNINRRQRTASHLYFFAAPTLKSAIAAKHNREFGGYQGHVLTPQYFGVLLVAVLAAGLAIWHRDRRLWLFTAIGLVSVLLSLGARSKGWLPWNSLQNLSVLDNVTPYRFVLITYLCAAVMLGLLLDHTYVTVNRRRTVGLDAPDGATGRVRHRKKRRSRWPGAVVAICVAVLALIQPVIYLNRTTPMVIRPVALPTWFSAVAPHLPAHQVLLVFPAPFTSFDNSMTWQAVDDMRYSMVGEGGPGGILIESGKEEPGAAVIAKASLPPTFSPGTLTAAHVSKVRTALEQWKVTMVVIPDQPGLPAYDQISSVTSAAALITAATGKLPTRQSGAWVWTDVDQPRPASTATTAMLSGCINGVATEGSSAVHRATSCVLSFGGPTR